MNREGSKTTVGVSSIPQESHSKFPSHPQFRPYECEAMFAILMSIDTNLAERGKGQTNGRNNRIEHTGNYMYRCFNIR
jgi:hypothetical protein